MSKKLLQAAAGAAAGEALYVEDVFSTYLYTGTDSTQTVTNGINLADEGGMVWTKCRSDLADHAIWDTDRGSTFRIETNNTDAQTSGGVAGLTYSLDGYSFTSASGQFNALGRTYVSWTFRKAEKFFDVVTYTGTGVAHDIPHNLGSVPACIIVKRTDGVDSWFVYHVGVDATAPEDYFLEMEKTAARTNAAYAWNDTAPTATHFTVGTVNDTNFNGGTFVAYLFASDAGGFGDDGSESIIKCGSYTGNGSTDGTEIDLGFEPQWILLKDADVAVNWYMFDNMRGIATGGVDAILNPNTTSAESASGDRLDLTPTGFKITTSSNAWNRSGSNFIYIAIRRPMKTPESGTEVFSPPTFGTGSAATRVVTTNFVVDLNISKMRSLFSAAALTGAAWSTRLTGAQPYLLSSSTSAEATQTDGFTSFASNTGYTLGADTTVEAWNADNNYAQWSFRRATGFFDVVCYEGVASSGNGFLPQDVDHNLVAVPEMMIVKCRSTGGTTTYRWHVYHKDVGNTQALFLNESSVAGTGSAYWNNTTPTDSVFSVGGGYGVNEASQSYIAYLFASVAGVSKVFSVTKSSGSDASVDCGFSAGPRFVMLKRTDSTGDWYIWDSVRGIVAGNDRYLLLNSTAAEVMSTDYIDPTASGFSIVNGGLADGDYIGLAIA